MDTEDWPTVLQIIQSVLNNAPRASSKDLAPITAFTGLTADKPLRTVLPPESPNPVAITEIKAKQIMEIEQLGRAEEEIHRDVANQKTRKREGEENRHNQRTNVKHTNFEIGDLLLVADLISRKSSKLKVKWKCPR